MEEVIERIKGVIESRGQTVSGFAIDAGIDQGNFNRKMRGMARITSNDFDKINRLTGINCEWLRTGRGEKYDNTNVKERTTHQASTNGGIPYYDIDFTCSVSEVYSDNPEYVSSFMAIPGVEKADFCCRTSGDSMTPFLMRGDIVAMRKIDDWSSFLPLNEVYGIVTTNGIRAIKVIKKGSSDSRLTLHSYNEEYEDQEIEKESILHIYKVVASARIM